MARQRPIKPEQPRYEPEIIPPSRGRRDAYQTGPNWFAGGERRESRIFIARLGPWSFVGIALLIGLFAGATLAIMLGTLLLAVPVVALLIAGAVIANAWRGRGRGT
jgi:hypothetical protein